MSNSSGSNYVSTEAFYKAFDSLPEIARKALANSNLDWAVSKFAARWKSGEYSPSQIVQMINRANKIDTIKHFARLERMCLTDIDYHARLTRAGLKKYSQTAGA